MDQDGDGYAGTQTVLSCAAPDNYVATVGDCDDGDAAVYPLAAELCDGVDNDCDGILDPDNQTWYRDVDGDGYGDPAAAVLACAQPAGTVDNDQDCDDLAEDAFPGGAEIWYDGVDQDCSGGSDYDADADGSDTDVFGGLDCDDTDAWVGPAQEEICHNGVDDDCSGADGQCDLPGEFELSDADQVWEGDVYIQQLGVIIAMTHQLSDEGSPIVAISSMDPWDYADGQVIRLLAHDGTEMAEVGRVVSHELYGDLRFVHQPFDFDGDGLVDLSLHASNSVYEVIGPGELYIFLKPVVGEVLADDADIRVTGEDTGAWGGYGLTGRLGWPDAPGVVAISSPGWDGAWAEQQSGRVNLVSLPDSGQVMLADGDSAIECHHEGCMLGEGLVSTDIDGDGIADLVASLTRTGQDPSTPSMVGTWLGPLSGAVSALDWDGALLSTTQNRVGEQLENLGDVDGDGVDELWLSAYFEITEGSSAKTAESVGAAWLYSASALGVASETGATASLTVLAADGAVNMGFSLGHGDVNGDGQLDLLAGAPYENGGGSLQGAAYIWYGPMSGTLTTADASVSIIGTDSYGELGWSLAADDDLNGDGCDDVVVGEPGWPGGKSYYGAAALFYGGCE